MLQRYLTLHTSFERPLTAVRLDMELDIIFISYGICNIVCLLLNSTVYRIYFGRGL